MWQGLSLNLNLTESLRLASLDLQGPACLCHHAQLFMWVLGIWTHSAHNSCSVGTLLTGLSPQSIHHFWTIGVPKFLIFTVHHWAHHCSFTKVKSVTRGFCYTVSASLPSMNTQRVFIQVLSAGLPDVLNACSPVILTPLRLETQVLECSLSLFSLHSVQIHSTLAFYLIM